MSEYSFEEAYKTNIVYIYTLNELSHKDCVKVGKASTSKPNPSQDDIFKAAKERVEGQLKTAGLKYKSLYAEEAVRIDADGVPHSFMDYEVHKVLERSGIKKMKLGSGAQEWFECSVETAKAAIKAVKENRQSLNASEIKDDFEPIIFRPEQQKAIEQTKKVFSKENDMLWNAKMRFGKTVTSLQVVKDMGFERTLIFTHRPVVVKGWYEDFQKIFFDRDDYAFGSKMEYGSDLDWLENNKKKYVFFASIQDLRGSEQVGGNFAKNQELYDTDWDCIIIDEAHEGTLTELGESVFESLKKANTKVLRLSGTPFNLLDKFNAANTYTWDYVMEQRAKAQWEVEHPGEPNPYAMLPAMCIYTYDISRLLGNDEVEEDSAFNFREFFRTDGDFDNFVHEDRVKAFLDLLIDNDANSMYPFSNERFENTFRHTLWMVPGVKAARALSDLLRKHDIFKKYNIVNVAGNGDEEEEHDEALHKVETAIGKDPTKTRTITLSCGKLTTGVSVPAWTGVLMLSGSVNTAASAYMQTIFRVQTPCSIGGLQKELCYVFDFAPDRTLQVLADVAHVENVGKGTTDVERKALGEFLNFCPVISYDNSQLRQYDTDLLFQKMKRVFVERVVKSGFDDDHIYNQQMLRNLNVDEASKFEKLRAQIGSTKAMPKSKGVDLANSGMTEEEYEQAKQDEEDIKKGKKKSVELTEEQRQRLEQLKQQRENAKAAASILRGISIRMPLMVYGANLKDEKKELTIRNFTKLVDDESWTEFMPEGVSKDLFNQFRQYFDEDIFAAASLRIRELTREADDMNIEERIEQIYTIFNYFRNPDKETVLTPPRVVNMHMGDTLGGWNFYQKTNEVGELYYDDEQGSDPVFINVDGVTDEVFATNSRILEVNSKSGLYPLYVVYSIYRKRLEQAAKKLTLKEQHSVWDETVANNVFVVCKTPMAAAITRRTLCGFRKVQCNAKHYPNLLTEIKNNQSKLIARLRMGKTFWGANAYDNMKFNAVVGNPPYQDSSINNHNAPVYHYFIDVAYNMAPFATLITPGRFLFGAGDTPVEWNEAFKSNRNYSVIKYASDSREFFPSVDIKGGVAITMCNAINPAGPIGFFTPHKQLKSIIEKVKQTDFSPMSTIVYTPATYKLSETAFEENSWLVDSVGREKRLRTNIFEKAGNLFVDIQPSAGAHIKVVGLDKGKRVTKWIKASYIAPNINKDTFKVIVAKANGSGALGETLANPIVAGPGDGHTETFISIGSFASREQADAVYKYVCTKFLRLALGSLKVTQDNFPEAWANIPLQDFTSNSDIDWSKSVEEIDHQLYAKYGLSEEEIAFVESMIKPME
ncbi:MAG: Eco57I restriction-modification methylase domain-containing protein [Marinilabiliaceae bacterium]|nr:Eco57I restriction-modification methylase domain-containing protein [Marinilabiliaceae bacterium]